MHEVPSSSMPAHRVPRPVGIALILAASVVACGESPAPVAGHDAKSAALTTPSAHERGRKIYNFRCYYCHGYSGDAKTLAASFLDPHPPDFTSTAAAGLSRERMIEAVTDGRAGTAMKGFSTVLSKEEVVQVVDFVRQEFMIARASNTRYHTAENGWPDHERRYGAAFPFATGALALDTPWERLAPQQQAAKRLFLTACITCHDRARVTDEGKAWDPRAVSYPRNQQVPGGQADAMAGASPYARHDIAPKIEGLTKAERRGERIFQDNCAFCHGAAGTGRNWIGSFLQPHPRDLTDPANMAGMTRARLREVIRNGLPGTSMPAWKNVVSEAEIEAIIAYMNRAFHPIRDDTSAARAASGR
jgi:cytochrome c oxidase cbb3-type subunit III